MKHDYKASMEAIKFCLEHIPSKNFSDDDNAIWSVGTASKPRITATVLKSALHALAMMQKLEEPSDGMKRVYATYKTTGIPTRNEYDHPEILKALLEQAEKEIADAR